MDWSKVPVEGEQMQEANKYLAERQAAQTAAKSNELTSRSVLSPEYRPRSPLGGQELGGLAGGIAGLIAGIPAGPLASAGLGTLGAGIGGAAGEAVEQFVRGEPMSGNRLAQAGFEEAAWDAAGNLVLKGVDDSSAVTLVVPAGVLIPVFVARVMAATTATSLVALY